jgi:hypothetical protein
MRMLRHRERALRLLEFVMPEPRLGELLDAPEIEDAPEAELLTSCDRGVPIDSG